MTITVTRKTGPEVAPLAVGINGAHVAAVGSSVHYGASERLITAAVSSNLATAITLANDLRRVWEGPTGSTYPGHRKDAVAHKAIDTTNVIALAELPSTAVLADVMALANEIKADYNAHRSQSGVHANNDGGNAIAAADATDQTELNTLLNEMRTDIAAHMAAAPTGAAPLRVVEA